MVYHDREKQKVILNCNCGSEFLCFEKIDDEHFVSLYVDTFLAAQEDIWHIIKERIKMAWCALTGKKYHLFDICVTQEDMKTLVGYLKEHVKCDT